MSGQYAVFPCLSPFPMFVRHFPTLVATHGLFSHICRCHLSFFPHLSLVFPRLSHHVRFFTRLSFLYIPLSHAYATSLRIMLHHYYITPLVRSLIQALCWKGPPPEV